MQYFRSLGSRPLKAGISALSALLLTGLSMARAEKNPLDRMLPVAATEQIPVIDFFRPWVFSSPQLNPSGTHFAAIVSTREDNHDLMAFNLTTKTADRLSGGFDFDVRGFRWLDDKALLFDLTRNKNYSAGLYGVRVGEFRRSYVIQRFSVIVPVGFPKNAPREAILWIRQSISQDGGDAGVVRVDAMSAMAEKERSLNLNDDGIRANILKKYPDIKNGDPVSYISDIQGELAFGVTRKDGALSLYRLTENHWEICPVNLDDVTIVGAGDRPGELLVTGPRQNGKPSGLFRLDAATGQLGELLLQDEKFDGVNARIYRHPADQHILGVQINRSVPDVVWFDKGYKDIQTEMEKVLPNQLVQIIGSDLPEKQFFVRAFSDTQPSSYYRVKTDSNTFSLVSNVAPWIDAKRMRPMQIIGYKTRDGFPIEAYLTLPAGASKENPAPLVVLPHGGPWARDEWGWNGEVQFLASRGYAVFQPNYRGSIGTAWQYPEHDSWEFKKMHNDVTDGVKRLIRSGMVDPKRIAIMGSSFGGYLALDGVTSEPDLYRCAVSIAGVFDWEHELDHLKKGDSRGRFETMKRKLGDPQLQQEHYNDISPLRHVANIKVPVFVAHGGDDNIAEVTQSKDLIAELKKHNVPFEKHIENYEGHGFHHLDNQVALYSEIEAFLAKNLAAVPPSMH